MIYRFRVTAVLRWAPGQGAYLEGATADEAAIPSPHDEGVGRGLGREASRNRLHGAERSPLPGPLPARASRAEGEDNSARGVPARCAPRIMESRRPMDS